MIRSRLLYCLFGATAAAIGIVLLLSPGAAAGLTTSDTVVLLLGVGAFGRALRALSGRTSPDRVTFPAPEYRAGTRIPGRSFDSRLARLDPGIRTRVERSVVAALERFRTGAGDGTVDPRRALREGTWTRDAMGAAFFAPGVGIGGRSRPRWLGGEPLVRKQARAAVSALSALVSEHVRGLDPIESATLARRGPGDSDPLDADPVPLEDAESPGEYRTHRWSGIGAVGLLTVAIAVLVREPSLLLVGAVGVALTGYSAYGRAGSSEDVDLAIERSLSTTSPARGDDVTVHVRVRNESDGVLPDVRLVDGVPTELVVSDGSARHVATLGPDRETSFTYSIEAEFGEHTFDPAFVLVQDPSGERQRVLHIDGNDVSLTCDPPTAVLEDVSVRGLTTGYPGRLTADEGGSGVQFHDTRQYQPGDPISLIDWKSLARTGELTTLRFEEERMAEVMVVVDSRPESNLSPSPTERSVIARSVEAADVLVSSLLEENHVAGLTAISPTRSLLQPGRGTEHRARTRQLLATHPAFDPPPAHDEYVVFDQMNWFLRNLSTTSQAILLTPLCDDALLTFIKRLEAGGTPITVISPDPTRGDTPGGLLARVDRQLRIAELRDVQIPVYEWRRDESLAVALERGIAMDG